MISQQTENKVSQESSQKIQAEQQKEQAKDLKDFHQKQVIKKGIRAKNRPKIVNNSINHEKKRMDEQQEWHEMTSINEKVHVQENSILQGYVKIIDFLKKIDFDENSLQNKMNPYHALTPTCFWYMVSAEYYHMNFHKNHHPNFIAFEIINKIQRATIQIPNRIYKFSKQDSLLNFQNQSLRQLAIPLAQKISHLIPTVLNSKSEICDKKLGFTSNMEDDLFISQTRAMLFNYLKRKINNSDKWINAVGSRLKSVQNVPSKTIKMPIKNFITQKIQQKEDSKVLNFFFRQSKKKSKKDKKNKKQDKLQEIQFKEEQDEEIDLENSFNKEEQSQNSNKSEIINYEQQLEQQYHQQINNNSPNKISIIQQLEKQKIYESQTNKVQLQQKQKQIIRNQKIQIKEQINLQKEQQIFEKIYNQNDLLLDSILHIPLDKIISILQSNLPTIKLPQITQPFISVPEKDPLEFVFQLHPEQQKYLDFMKQYQRKKYCERKSKNDKITEEQERQGQFQDAKCQICTDGDYTEDNLIVFCSMCNISLHQRCVGLAKVPAQSWVCELCTAFGPAGINVPCPLCDAKGGALKRTTLHIDTNIFKDINPDFHQFGKRCSYSKQKEQYIHNQDDQKCYYDYFDKETYSTQKPVCHYVWTHYVCTIWIPQCYFEQKNGLINIRGLQTIQKRRFREQCYVCHKIRNGACVKCDEPLCSKHYHPQCARKKKVYMEQLNLDKIKYLIFCGEHQPLKLARKIQYRKKKNRDEIIKFTRMIQKYIETYRIAYFPFKMLKNITNKPLNQNIDKIQEQKFIKTSYKPSDEQFINQILNNLVTAKSIRIKLIRQNGYKLEGFQFPSKRTVKKCLSRYDQFWNSLNNGQSVQINHHRYEKIMHQNNKLKQKVQNFLDGNIQIHERTESQALLNLFNRFDKNKNKKMNLIENKQDLKKIKNKNKKYKQNIIQQTHMQQEGGIFCICRQPYKKQMDMFQCQICQQWFHFKCLGFIGTQKDAQNMEFHCMKCMKYQDQEIKKQRIQKYKHLFQQNSAFFNYNPSTPQLLSENQQCEKQIIYQEQLQFQNILQKNKFNQNNNNLFVLQQQKEIQSQNIAQNKLQCNIDKNDHNNINIIDNNNINVNIDDNNEIINELCQKQKQIKQIDIITTRKNNEIQTYQDINKDSIEFKEIKIQLPNGNKMKIQKLSQNQKSMEIQVIQVIKINQNNVKKNNIIESTNCKDEEQILKNKQQQKCEKSNLQ